MIINTEQAEIETVEFRLPVPSEVRDRLEVLSIEHMDSCRYEAKSGELMVKVRSTLYK